MHARPGSCWCFGIVTRAGNQSVITFGGEVWRIADALSEQRPCPKAFKSLSRRIVARYEAGSRRARIRVPASAFQRSPAPGSGKHQPVRSRGI